MTLEIFSSYETLSAAAARAIADLVRSKPAAVLCLATGDTPRQTYAALRSIRQQEGLNFAECTLIALDEWVGIPADNSGSCAFFLQRYVVEPLGISAHQVHLFNAMAQDPGRECARMNQVVATRGIDLMLVGVGMNGHIGFNEPGTSVGLDAHVATLDETTRSVGQKYFASATPLELGMTLGLKQFLESRSAILLASGAKKADSARRALDGPVTSDIPASFIQRHPNATVMLDDDAASMLKARR